VQGGKVVPRGLGAADQPVAAILAQQHLGAAQLAVVVVAHGRAVGAGVVDIDQIPDVDPRQHPVHGELVVVLAQAAHHVVFVVAGGVLLAQHRDVVVGAVHGRAHQVGGAGVQADVLLIDVLFVDGGGDQRAVGPGHEPAHLGKDGNVPHAGRDQDLLKLFADRSEERRVGKEFMYMLLQDYH